MQKKQQKKKKKEKQNNIGNKNSSAITLEKNTIMQPEFIVDWARETIKDFSGHQVSSGYIKIQFNVEKSFFTDPNTNPYNQ